MGLSNSLFGSASDQIMAAIYISLVWIPATVVCDAINTEIITAATGIHDLNVFQATPEGSVEIKSDLDIVMTLDVFKEMNSPKECCHEEVTMQDLGKRWPNGVVFYEIGDGNKEKEQFVITVEAAINQYMKYTCLNFIENRFAYNRIAFFSGNGCWSYYGMKGGKQKLSLGPGCESLSIALHEIGHAIGFLHEHLRPDRDKYIKTDSRSLFNTTFLNTYNTSYDYKSIMHYSGMQTLDPKYQDVIGMAKGLSFKDIKLANLMYSCDFFKGCPLKECSFNGFMLSLPYNGQPECECWCESGHVNDPLVLCSSISSEAEGPNKQSASSLPSLNISECRDLRENCLTLKQRGMCVYEFQMMMHHCPETCNYCDRRKEFCIDSEDSCGILARSGGCTENGLAETMSILCMKSCRLCTTNSSLCEIEKGFIQLMSLNSSDSVRNIRLARCGILLVLLNHLVFRIVYSLPAP